MSSGLNASIGALLEGRQTQTLAQFGRDSWPSLDELSRALACPTRTKAMTFGCQRLLPVPSYGLRGSTGLSLACPAGESKATNRK